MHWTSVPASCKGRYPLVYLSPRGYAVINRVKGVTPLREFEGRALKVLIFKKVFEGGTGLWNLDIQRSRYC